MGKATFLLLLSLVVAVNGFSQTVSIDSLAKKVNTIEENVGILKRVKFTGYIQAQWQKAEAKGAKNIAGGNFPATEDNRFLVRRARLKMTYSSDPVTAVIQIDALPSAFLVKDVAGSTGAPSGFVVRDAYGAVRLPGSLKNISLQGGIFYRPFGHEVSYSSGVRETPERSRMMQTLLPDERDMGCKLIYTHKYFKLEGGLFNGNAISLENDSKKDFIGRVSTSEFKRNKFTLSYGASFYSGGVWDGTNHVYDFDGDHFSVQDTTKGNLVGHHAKRQYIGADVQLSLQSAVGKTAIRAEIITGTQPGTSTSSTSPRTSALPDKDTYIRPFQGAVVYLLQNFGKSNWQGVVKYDFYDPNKDISDNQIGASNTLTNEGDIKYSTLGLGLNYYYKTVTFMAYYDLVKNETSSNLASYTKDLKDNIFTFRVQYKY